MVGRHPRIRLAVVALVLAGLAALAAAARVFLTGDRLAALIIRQTNAAIRGSVSLGSATFRLPAHVALEDVALRDPSGIARVRVARIEVDLAPLALLARTVEVSHLTLQGASLDLAAATPGGRAGVLEALEPRPVGGVPGPPSGWRLRFGEARVEGLRVTGLPSENPPLPGPIDLELRGASYVLASEVATLDGVDARIGASRAHAVLRVRDLSSSPRLEGDGTATLALADLAPFLPRALGSGAVGVLELGGDVHVEGGLLSGGLHAQATDARVGDLAVSSLDCVARFDRDIVTVSDCALSPAAGGTLHLAGKVDRATSRTISSWSSSRYPCARSPRRSSSTRRGFRSESTARCTSSRPSRMAVSPWSRWTWTSPDFRLPSHSRPPSTSRAASASPGSSSSRCRSRPRPGRSMRS